MTLVRFARRAEVDAARIAAWWSANRPASPDLFASELAEAARRLEDAPAIGAPYRTVRGRSGRRLFLRGAKQHVYYWHDEAGSRVEIVAIWGASRARGPRLG